MVLKENEFELGKTQRHINILKQYFPVTNSRWDEPSDRVIGHVIWAPSISAGAALHGYTRDLCVVELYKAKFRNMVGDVLNLGMKYHPYELKSLIYGRLNIPSESQWPEDGLLPLHRILIPDEISNSNSKDF